MSRPRPSRRPPLATVTITALSTLAKLSVMVTLALATPSACARSGAHGDPPASCAKLGDSCTFAPGKLGVCVEPVDGKRGLVCQSQH